jgi:hypothetical protein
LEVGVLGVAKAAVAFQGDALLGPREVEPMTAACDEHLVLWFGLRQRIAREQLAAFERGWRVPGSRSSGFGAVMRSSPNSAPADRCDRRLLGPAQIRHGARQHA